MGKQAVLLSFTCANPVEDGIIHPYQWFSYKTGLANQFRCNTPSSSASNDLKTFSSDYDDGARMYFGYESSLAGSDEGY